MTKENSILFMLESNRVPLPLGYLRFLARGVGFEPTITFVNLL